MPLSLIASRRMLTLSFGVVIPSILSACASLSFVAANVPASFGSYKAARNIKYGELDRQALDVYTPHDTNSRRPIVIFIHGGSWTSGSKSEYLFLAESLTSRGFVTVVPNYRLHPQVKFPAFVEDIAIAVAWTRAHAPEFGGDTQRIFLMGHSAGAQIGAMLVFDDEYLRRVGGDPSWIKGFIGVAGPYDFLPFEEQYLRDIFGPESEYARSQPINFVNSDPSKIPPALLIHGDADTTVWPKNSRNLAKRMRAAGAQVVERYYPGMNHTDVMAAFSVYFRGRRSLLNEVDTFINGNAIDSAQKTN